MNTSSSCLCDKDVNVMFPIIMSCFKKYTMGKKINAPNILWNYCILQIDCPLPPLLSVEIIIA